MKAFLSAGMFAYLILTGMQAHAQTYFEPGVPYYIVARNCGKVLNVNSPGGDGTGCVMGNKIQLYEKTDHNCSKWVINPVEGSRGFTIESYQCGLALSLKSPLLDGDRCMNEATAVLQQRNQNPPQEWIFEPTGWNDGSVYIIAAECGKALNLYSPQGTGTGCNDGQKIQIYDKVESDVSAWLLLPAAQKRATTVPITTGAQDHFENTVEVIGPSENCTEGAINFYWGSWGSNMGNSVIRHSLNSYLNGTLTVTPATVQPVVFPTEPGIFPATDNQIIKAPDGSLIALRHTGVSRPNVGSPYANESVVILGNIVAGARGGTSFYRSTDCGVSWKFLSVIDPAHIGNGIVQFPRPAAYNNPSAPSLGNIQPDVAVGQQSFVAGSTTKKLWWPGDFDREEIYACPFSGIIYVSARYRSGPYKNKETGTDEPYRASSFIFYSDDMGQSWKVLHHFTNDEYGPKMMTSTPDGRFFVFWMIGIPDSGGEGQPLLAWSLEPVTKKNVSSVKIGNQHAINYQLSDPGSATGTKLLKYSEKPSISIARMHAWNAISRVNNKTGDGSTVRIAYQYENPHHRLGVAAVSATVHPDGSLFTENIGLIESLDPQNTSVCFGAFVEPDGFLNTDCPNDLSLFYWLESPPAGAPNQYVARYCIFSGAKGMSPPEFLSGTTAQNSAWTNTTEIGDYFTGAFFWLNNQMNFFCQWKQGTEARSNIVSVPYSKE